MADTLVVRVSSEICSVCDVIKVLDAVLLDHVSTQDLQQSTPIMVYLPSIEHADPVKENACKHLGDQTYTHLRMSTLRFALGSEVKM